jgi:tRNA dimethylallyltransferase
VAIQLAQAFQTEIISADSRQCFKEMAIGVARPSTEELAAIPHHFIASHSIHAEVTAATFEAYALEKVKLLFQQHDKVVMVGGTGLYIKAFCEGLDLIPDIDPVIRHQVIQDYEAKGLSWLQETLKEKDPLFYTTGEIQNPQRGMRALEVCLSTGRSIVDYRTGRKAARDFRVIKIGLDIPKEILHSRIHQRVDQMMIDGLEEEVRSLYPYKELNALQTVGYAEMFDFMDGKLTSEQAVDAIKTHTRQYAKRQLTWFRKDADIHWFAPGDMQSICTYISQHS